MILNEHQKLLVNREGMVVLGKKCFNLWLLTLVLFVTFLSIAFSNGSMEYLSYKMDDPFTNWVDIPEGYEQEKFEKFKLALEDTEVKDRFLFKDAQFDSYKSYTIATSDGNSSHFLDIRFFGSFESELIQAILSEDNVIKNYSIPIDSLVRKTYGVIITRDALLKLGYKLNNPPAYINRLSSSAGADKYGIKLVQDLFAPTPLPVLAVVKSLPGKMDMIASDFLFNQLQTSRHPFNLNDEDYIKDLLYYFEGDVDDFVEKVTMLIPDSLRKRKLDFSIGEEELPHLSSWKDGKLMAVSVGNFRTDIQAYVDLNDKILKTYNGKIIRLYNYYEDDYHSPVHNYLSLNFYSLDSIRAFEQFAKSDEYEVQIEMSQVIAKENFNAVSVMANILSSAMILFSIVCIIMFIVNMLQSYFQKVKRNIGTFKAFGIDSEELIRVYVLILFIIVLIAIVLSLSFTWIIELFLVACNVMKDGTHSYLLLWSPKTFIAIFIVLVATVATVYFVMNRLLRQTPGDLIYDRN